jgi:hypothetical protein
VVLVQQIVRTRAVLYVIIIVVLDVLVQLLVQLATVAPGLLVLMHV